VYEILGDIGQWLKRNWGKSFEKDCFWYTSSEYLAPVYN